jgi:predicted phage terminase large subunit-like protein
MKGSVLEELVGSGEAAKRDRAKRDRVERAKRDFGFFCETYLADYFFTEPAEYQRVLYEVADSQALTPSVGKRLAAFVREKYRIYLTPTPRLSGAMFIEPREHGKTVRWSFAYPLWRALSGRSRYVLLIGAAGAAAKENLSNIKRELEENELLLEDFGDLKGELWRDDRIELSISACLQAKGAGASMRGTRFRQYRPDLIILDDVLKDSDVESPTIRTKIHRWLKRVVFNLGKNAFTIWVNTIFHADDPISRLMAELEAGTLKRWIAVRLSCFRPDGAPLWPENWPSEVLEEKREQLGADVFSTEYENEPLSDEERIIKADWVKRHEYAQLEYPLGSLRNFAGVDPATGKHDQTAIVTIGVDPRGKLWEIDSWGRACSETETVRQLIEKHRAFRFELIGWEEVNFTGIYANYVIDLSAAAGVYLPIKKVQASTTANAKSARLRSLSPLLENGTLRIRDHGARDLVDQITNYPKAKFDDQCDALWYAVNVAARGPGAPLVLPFDRFGLRSKARKALRGFAK